MPARHAKITSHCEARSTARRARRRDSGRGAARVVRAEHMLLELGLAQGCGLVVASPAGQKLGVASNDARVQTPTSLGGLAELQGGHAHKCSS